MLYEMNLNGKAFINIKNGIKKFELRLYDEKRKKISLNDIIEFHNLDQMDETIKVKVIGLLRYNTFRDLFNDIDYNLCGPATSLEEKLKRVHTFYTEDQENQNGILAIKIELINN